LDPTMIHIFLSSNICGEGIVL